MVVCYHRITDWGYGRECTSLPHDFREQSVRGGDNLSRHDGIVSSKKGSTRIGGHWLDYLFIIMNVVDVALCVCAELGCYP